MGGAAFSNTRPIKREEIESTVQYIAELAGVEAKDLHVLGSAGKKAESGDLDIGISLRKADPEEVDQRLRESLGEGNGKYTRGFDTYSYSVPIDGNPRNGRIQVDLMYNNVEFLKFSHYSAGDRSKYKGFMRTRLLATLAAMLPDENSVTVKDPDTDETILRIRRGLDVNRGLKLVCRHRPLTKKGDRYKKNFESISPAMVEELYPDVEIDRSQSVIKDPKKITEILFGPGVSPRDIQTAEQVIELIQQRRPELSDRVFMRVKSALEQDGRDVPVEILEALGESASAVEQVTAELASSALPEVEFEWREFRRPGQGKRRAQIWAIRQEGESFYIKHGREGGKLNETGDPITPGPLGKEESTSYVSAEENCRLEVERRIKKKLSSGYGELIDGVAVGSPVAAFELDFSRLVPENFRFPKPKNSIKEDAHRKIHEEGEARYTRKYDGNSAVLVHHDHGWEIYTLNMNRMTDRFPEAVEALSSHAEFGVGTVIQAEAVMFDPERPEREDYDLISRYRASSPEKGRALRESGELPDPAFVIFDVVFHNGMDLSEQSYDQRSTLWRDLPVARGGNGPLQSVEYFDLSPDTWQAKAEEIGIEGFVLTKGSAIPGDKFWSVGGANPRPNGSYKLKPEYEEDLVVYAVRRVNGKYESLFTKQRYPSEYPTSGEPHPRAGEWFTTGRVSVANAKKVHPEIDELVAAGKITVVESNKEGEAIPLDQEGGAVAMVPFMDRYPSQKLRHAKFAGVARFRDDKTPEECTAHMLYELKPVEPQST